MSEIEELRDEIETLKREMINLRAGQRAFFQELESHFISDVDISVRGPCTMILTGEYKGRGFIKFYDMDLDEFRARVEEMRGRKSLRNIDAPHDVLQSFNL